MHNGDGMTKIKLCGIRKLSDVDTVNELKPDYIGFVFCRSSKRYIEPSEALRIRSKLDPKIKTVGVFVDEDEDTVAGLLNDGTIDLIQLHGHEDAEYIRRLRHLTGRPYDADGSGQHIIKACRITSKTDLAGLEKEYGMTADARPDLFLLDAGAGDGITFDWEWLKGYDIPYILAGGLTPDNVGKAIEMHRPYGVDVSSGIETDGSKDPEKMARFVREVKDADKRIGD